MAGELPPRGGAGIGGREQGEARMSLLVSLSLLPVVPPAAALLASRSGICQEPLPLCGQAGSELWSSFHLRA